MPFIVSNRKERHVYICLYTLDKFERTKEPGISSRIHDVFIFVPDEVGAEPSFHLVSGIIVVYGILGGTHAWEASLHWCVFLFY